MSRATPAGTVPPSKRSDRIRRGALRARSMAILFYASVIGVGIAIAAPILVRIFKPRFARKP